jgi:signal peptidase I
MIWDFLNILALVTILAGVICLVDIIWRKKKGITVAKEKKHPLIIDYARSFFPVLLIVLIIRSFLFQPYRVPTGSLEPTIMPGDLILVSQYDYGLRIPLWNKSIVNVSTPKTGQIALFRWPVNPGVTFVKRVIGVPGDHISYVNKVLYINGKQMSQKFVKDTLEIGSGDQTWPAKQYEEDLNGVHHYILIRADRPSQDFKELVVPPGEYFMMGDNRDDSDDCRSWGFVSNSNLVGRALLIWMSWDSQHHRVRWDRIGMKFNIDADKK